MSVFSELTKKINKTFEGKEAWQVVRDTVVATAVVYYGYRAISDIKKRGLKTAVASNFVGVAKQLPGAGALIEQKQKEDIAKLQASLLDQVKDEKRNATLPKTGVPQAELKETLKKWKEVEEKHWKTGKVSGGVYHGGDELVAFLTEVYGYFALSNPLHSEVHPYVRKMEAEVVRMTVDLFNGDETACGAMTSGGTESILMAMKSYRDQARDRGITKANVIAPITAHAAFDKAAHYFGFELISIPVDPKTYKVDIKAVKKAINKNTIALVGSAPNFPQGVMDSITELAALALEHKVGLHVDSCLGGFLLPFLTKLGYPIPPFDFRVKGVTSISADSHKYGYSPKGSSVVMFSTPELRRYMYFVATEWPGGIYATPTTGGSRPGAIIAATWAAMMTMGESGYLECARAIMESATKIKKGIAGIDGLKVMGDPEMSVVAFTPDLDSPLGKKLNIYMISDAMRKKYHWNLNTLQSPGAMHICCTYLHKDVADQFLSDLKTSVKLVSEHPEQFRGGAAAIYGLAETIDDPAMVGSFAKGFIDALYTV